MSKIEKIEAFKLRTKAFALMVIKLFQALPKTEEAKLVGRQLMRSATSVAANYRAACRARSDAELYSKISIVVEEADETQFWLEILLESNIYTDSAVHSLRTEAEEIVKIMNATKHKLKRK